MDSFHSCLHCRQHVGGRRNSRRHLEWAMAANTLPEVQGDDRGKEIVSRKACMSGIRKIAATKLQTVQCELYYVRRIIILHAEH